MHTDTGIVNADKEELLFIRFADKWTIPKMQSLTLQEYSNENNNSFIYDIEFQMKDIGSMKGGSAFKFGIFKRNNKDIKHNIRGYIYGKEYAWRLKFGNSEQEAFENVKSLINEVIENVRNNKSEELDKIDLGDVYKWKIAFHFQDRNNPTVIPVFVKEALEVYIQNHNIACISGMNIAQLQSEIIKYDVPETLKDMINLSKTIWDEYLNSKNFNVSADKPLIKESSISESEKSNATSNAEYIEYQSKAKVIKYHNNHNKLEKSFLSFLKKINAGNIKQNERYIDFQFEINNKKYVCELKPTDNQTEIKDAVTSAIGQILGYAYKINYDYKVIVFQKKPIKDNSDFLDYLEKEHNICYLFETQDGIFEGNVPLT